jgi:hypothetical protein
MVAFHGLEWSEEARILGVVDHAREGAPVVQIHPAGLGQHMRQPCATPHAGLESRGATTRWRARTHG